MKHIFSVGISLMILTGICPAQDSLHLVIPKTSYEKNESVMAQWNSKQYFLKKRNSLNATAWVLLCTGAIFSIGGSMQYENAIHSNDRNRLNKEIGGAVLTVAGSTMVIASVPIFIKAGYYERKVVDMSANLQFQPSQPGLAIKQYPAISLRISLKS
jgi:hypothetical protein